MELLRGVKTPDLTDVFFLKIMLRFLQVIYFYYLRSG